MTWQVGLLWGMVFQSIAFIIGLGLYRLHSPWQKVPFTIMIFSGLGHFMGTWIMAHMSSDASAYYFPDATPEFKGLGHLFVLNIVWYVRKFLTGDSYMGTLYFFSMFAFLGSVLWYLFYLQLLKVMRLETSIHWFPALLILCFPSFLFFTSGIKDSISFFAIPITLMVMSLWHSRQGHNILIYLAALPVVVLLLMVRPYLAMIFAGSYCLARLNVTSKTMLRQSVMLVFFLMALFAIVQWVLLNQTGIDIIANPSSIASYMLRVQQAQNVGSSFPMLSSQSGVLTVLLMLPYGFVMNLFMPLFVFAGKGTGIIASLENVFLIGIFYQFWNKRKIYAFIKTQCPAVKFYLYFFVVGMLFLAALNTNLGLAMREKSMYLPAFFMVSMLVWTYDRHLKGVPKVQRLDEGQGEKASGMAAGSIKIILKLHKINTVN